MEPMTIIHTLTKTKGNGKEYPKFTVDGDLATEEEYKAYASIPWGNVTWIRTDIAKTDNQRTVTQIFEVRVD